MVEAVWTEDHIATLKKLWAEGKSASQIAKEIGGYTRNAVISKVHRMHLPARRNPLGTSSPRKAHGNRNQPKVNAILNKVAARKKAPPPPKPVSVPRPPRIAEQPEDHPDAVDVSHLVGILDNAGCKWIHGDPLGEHGYCGQPFKDGSRSWCDQHYRRVYPARAAL